MIRKKRAWLILLNILILLAIVSCLPKKDDSDKQDLKFNVMIKKSYNNTAIREYFDLFEDENKGMNIKIEEFEELSENIAKDISKGEVDLFISDREDLMILQRKGLIKNLDDTYEEYKLCEDMYDVVKAYGRIGEKYYGIGLICNTYEVIVNEESLESYGISFKELQDSQKAIEVIKNNNITIPVITNNDITYEDIVLSYIFNDKVNSNDFIKVYEKSYEDIAELKDIESNLENAMVYKNFISGNKEDLTRLEDGRIPCVIMDSLLIPELKNQDELHVVNNVIYEDKKLVNLVDVNTIMSIPVAAKNSDSYDKFLEFAIEEKNIDTLIKKNITTFNKFENEKLTGKLKEVSNHLNLAGEKNMLFKYNLSNKNYIILKDKLKQLYQ